MTLPPLPATVFSHHGPIPVLIVEDLADDEGAPVFGLWDPMARTISIRAGMSPVMQRLTLEHERTHADLVHLGVTLSEDQAESICNAIASVRVAELLARL